MKTQVPKLKKNKVEIEAQITELKKLGFAQLKDSTKKTPVNTCVKCRTCIGCQP